MVPPWKKKQQKICLPTQNVCILPNNKYYAKTMGNFYKLKIFPLRLWRGHVMYKSMDIGPFNYDEQNGCLKISIGQFWGKRGWGRGPSCPPIFLSIEKGPRTFNFRSNEPSHDILGPLGRCDHPWKKNTHPWSFFWQKIQNSSFLQIEAWNL